MIKKQPKTFLKTVCQSQSVNIFQTYNSIPGTSAQENTQLRAKVGVQEHPAVQAAIAKPLETKDVVNSSGLVSQGISAQVLVGRLSCLAASNNPVWLWVGNRLENRTVCV